MRRYVKPAQSAVKPAERPSVKSATEEAVRRRFISKAVGVADSAKTIHDLKPSMFKIDEWAAAKRPMAAPRDITLDSSPKSVQPGPLEDGEIFDMHTHDKVAFPSNSDIRSLVSVNKEPHQITHVIEVLDSGSAHIKLSAAIRRGLGGKRALPPKEDVMRLALHHANITAGNINLAGRVLLIPSQALLGLTNAKRKELSAYLDEAVEHKMPVHALKAVLTRKYGQLFIMRRIAMPGYRYDKGEGMFVKRKR